MRMRFRLLVGLFLVVAVIAGCSGPPPTVIYIVISPTPSDVTEVAATQAVSIPETVQTEAVAALPTATEPPSSTATQAASSTPTTVPTNTSTPLPPTPAQTALP